MQEWSWKSFFSSSDKGGPVVEMNPQGSTGADPLPAPGIVRSLQACATASGVFTILAADHRDALRKAIDPAAPKSVPDARLIEIKLDLVRELGEVASAVLLDPLYSAAQAIVSGTLSGQVGLLCALEEQGYLGDARGRKTTLIDGWSVEQAGRLGANGVKLLLFYHPGAGAAAAAQEDLVRALVADCRRFEIPLFLEPMSYSNDPKLEKGSPEFAALRRRIVIQSARRLGALGPDILKVEFPLDVKHDTDQGAWADACAELHEASPVPWTLLSAGEPYATFQDQLRIACQAGCSGFVVGRAVWQEAVSLSGAERARSLTEVARPRLARLREIAEQHAAPWHTRYATPTVEPTWFRAKDSPGTRAAARPGGASALRHGGRRI